MIVYKAYPHFVLGTISAFLVCYIPALFIFSNPCVRNSFPSLFKHSSAQQSLNLQISPTSCISNRFVGHGHFKHKMKFGSQQKSFAPQAYTDRVWKRLGSSLMIIT